MNFDAWCREWFARHPVRVPARHDAGQYTSDVMQRIRALQRPARAAAPHLAWFTWPRLALASALAGVAVALVAGGVTRGSSTQLAERVMRDAQVLAEFDDPFAVEPIVDGDAAALAQDLEHADTIVLAEAQ